MHSEINPVMFFLLPMPGKEPRIGMGISRSIRRFLFPVLTGNYLTRLILLGLSCFLFFSYILIPIRIQGHSMEPTYRNGSYAFCVRPQYLFTPIKRFDVVTVRFTGRSVMLLKRVLALPGDTLEFREGTLYINEERIDEPYLQHHSSWNLPVREVKQGYVYVVGDNRSTSMSEHHFGQVKIERIIGGVLF